MISIITPHYNDLKGIERLFHAFLNQRNKNFEWIIVDDVSKLHVQKQLRDLRDRHAGTGINVNVIFSSSKLYAAGARNLGVETANFEKIGFLDSDDMITIDFIANRIQYPQYDLVVYSKIIMITDHSDLNGNDFNSVPSHFLQNFLAANFCWQTSAMIFSKEYFLKIGGFNENLILLEDVLLSIKSLVHTSNSKVIPDNKVDFYYFTRPIDISKRTYLKNSISVRKMLEEIGTWDSQVVQKHKNLIPSYYFLACRYFVKDKRNLKNTTDLISLLFYFYQKKYISVLEFLLGLTSFMSLPFKDYFLRINRKLFKRTFEND